MKSDRKSHGTNSIRTLIEMTSYIKHNMENIKKCPSERITEHHLNALMKKKQALPKSYN